MLRIVLTPGPPKTYECYLIRYFTRAIIRKTVKRSLVLLPEMCFPGTTLPPLPLLSSRLKKCSRTITNGL